MSPGHGGKTFLLVVVFCFAILLLPPAAYALNFTATLDRDTIALGDTASLSVKFEGASPNDVPTIPPIAGLQLNYLGPSSQFSFVNGQTSSSVTHTFQVTPRQVGVFAIPALTATVNGQKFITQPLRLTVLKPNAPSPEAVASGQQIAFMRFLLPKKEIYLGETIMGELQIYFRDVVQNFGNFQITSMPTEGFTVLKKDVQGQQRRVQVGNAIYTLIPLYYVLSPVKTGPQTIGPITARVVVELPGNNRRRDPLFEQFGIRSMFNEGEQKQLNLVAETVNVNALPLPAEKMPPGFNGAVGNYTMTVTAGPTNVATGDPITVRVQISGRGALDALTLPEQTAWRDFKAYPPTANVETTDQLGLQGVKTFEQIVTPQNSDIKELPGFSFSFFDPDTRAYRTLTQPAVALVVRPGGVTPAPVIAVKHAPTGEPPPAQDIVHIKTRPGALAQAGPPLAMRPWFVAAQSVPVLAFVAAFIWRKRTESLANNPRLRRQRQVAHILRNGLGELRNHASAQDSDAFFATLVRLLQEQIGERLDCPASAITEAVIDEKLRPRGLPADTLATLHELFQAANLARYAPVRSELELAAIVPKLESALSALREVKA